jgi:SAM-dependent methyltransferase
VLDVGCANGELGKLLKQRGHQVAGIELVAEAAERARCWLDRVEAIDIETSGFPFPAGSFDAIVFADVLEHLIDPWRILKDAATLLVSGGVVVASIPNLQNFAVLRRLTRGRWEYRHRGITDFGHLRFFTLRTINHLFCQAGLKLTRVNYHYRRSWRRSLACLLTAGAARPFLARQYLVVGSKA